MPSALNAAPLGESALPTGRSLRRWVCAHSTALASASADSGCAYRAQSTCCVPDQFETVCSSAAGAVACELAQSATSAAASAATRYLSARRWRPDPPPPFARAPASAAPSPPEMTARCREANRMISSLLGCAVANGPLYEAAATPARPPDAVRRATTTTPCGKSAPGRTSSPSARGARRGAEDGSRGAAEANARRTAASMRWRPLIACAGRT